MHSQSDHLEAGVRIGDFEIEKRLGAGGMGIVYQARQLSLGRRVALKVLGPALTHSGGLARFQREAQAAARLKHPGIGAIYFIGQDADVCYHVMELVDGIPLQQLIERLAQTQIVQPTPDTLVSAELTAGQHAPTVRFDDPAIEPAGGNGQPASDSAAHDKSSRESLSPAAKQTRGGAQFVRRCCEIVRDAARALAYAHGEGVVHRDIKPGNLMLDKQGQVRIIDFGLARFFDDVSITHTGQLVGTPLYMSPEQVTGRIKVDHRTDIYSLGLVLYELLALRPPFDGLPREALLRSIVTKALPPLCGRNPALPKALEAVVHKATHKDPEERYQSAADLVDELERFLEGKPVLAPPYRYRMDPQEMVARRPGGVVLAAFICLMCGFSVFAGLSGFGIMMGVMASPIVMAVNLLLGTALFAGAIALARGLLAGWNAARWIALAGAGVLAVVCVVAGVSMVAAAYSLALPASSTVGVPPSGGRNAPAAGAGTRPAPGELVVSPSGGEPPAGSHASSPPEGGTTNGRPRGGESSAAASRFSSSNLMLGIVGMYSVPVLLGFVCAVTTLGSLLLPGTRAWFTLASEARREHRSMLESLAE